MDVFELTSDKTFVSCSSDDKEFNSVLQAVKNRVSDIVINPLEDIIIRTKSNHKIRLIAGRFPINFDRTPACDPEEIILTRGLLLGGCIQASQYFNENQKANSKAANVENDKHDLNINKTSKKNDIHFNTDSLSPNPKH